MPEAPGAAAAEPGAAEPDVETQSLAGSPGQHEGYGATCAGAEGAPGKKPPPAPLLLGRFLVQPQALLRAIVAVYAGVFAVNMLADLVYLGSVDARLPPGLQGDYPEAERLQSVMYTKRTLGLSMLHRATRFSVVMAFVYCCAFSRVDAGLRELGQRLAAFYEENCLCAPCRALASWLSWALDLCGRRCCCCCGCGAARRCFERHSASELLLGSVYLSLFTACFFLVSAPFQYWSQSINLEFGFANPLTVTDASFRRSFVAGLKQALVLGIPGRFFYLALLQFRHGWLGMWAATVVLTVVVQYNFSLIAPAVVGTKDPFPSNVFAVGRGFPLARTSDGAGPLVSLNRIYLNNTGRDPSQLLLETKDKSPGQLVLRLGKGSSLVIAAKAGLDPQVYASAPAPSGVGAEGLLGRVGELGWNLGGPSARVGARSGGDLRAKVLGWARERNISIAEIYLVDGSHKDSRANAFVGGLGTSIIGLYDTLFLGARASDAEPAGGGASQILTGADAGIQALTRLVQDVDVSAEDGEAAAGLSGAATQAMTDDEIVAILAHELAHAARGHLEQGMVVSAATSLVTYAAVGWAAHSPLLAASLLLSAPMAHVGACFDSHLLGPPLDWFLALFSDWLTRKNEYEADAYVARISPKYGSALQSALVKLTVNSNQDPDMPLWYEALRTDHPTTANRWAHIEAAKREALRSPGPRGAG